MNLIERYGKIGDIPVVLLYDEDIYRAGERGTILFYHGLYSDKEKHIKELKSLAKEGFLAVGIDAIEHGKRGEEDLREKLGGDNFNELFINIVQETSLEVSEIIDDLIKEGFSKEDKIGICGISMGGYIAYAAAVIEPRLKVVVPILASPEWEGVTESPNNFPERFYPKALLVQNGGIDVSVPPINSRQFVEKLKPYYKDNMDRLKYIEYEKSGHFMIEEDWYKLWSTVLKWFIMMT